MFDSEDICSKLTKAVCEGSINVVRDIIRDVGISYAPSWCKGYTLLYDAIKHRKVEVAKLLLREGAHVNSKDSNILDTPLHLAVRMRNTEIVKILLNRDLDINAKDNDGQVPLHLALNCGSQEMVKLLLNKLPELNVRDNFGLMPIHIAIKNGYLGNAEDILRHGACVNSVCTSSSEEGYTPLHYAALKIGNVEIVKLLLESGADVDAKEKNGNTPLHFSVEREHFAIAEVLIGYGACVNSVCTGTWNKGPTQLYYTERRECEVLLNNGAAVNTNAEGHSNLLLISTKRANKNRVKFLLEHGADVNSKGVDGKTPLYIAVNEGFLDIVDEILKFRPNFDDECNRLAINKVIGRCGKIFEGIVENFFKYGYRPRPEDINNTELSHYCVKKGFLAVVEDLLNFGVDVNALHTQKKGHTLLHNAAFNNQLDILKMIIKFGGDVNAKEYCGNTAINYSVQNKNLEMTKLLLESGANVKTISNLLPCAVRTKNEEIIELLLRRSADVNGVDEWGATSLHNAVENGNVEVALLMLQNGADVNAKDKNGKSALHISVRDWNKEMVQLLLEYNANVNSRDHKEKTPLHVAAKKKCETIVKVLLQNGADVDCKNGNDDTALSIVCGNGSANISEYLLSYGADVTPVSDYWWEFFLYNNSDSWDSDEELDFYMDGIGDTVKHAIKHTVMKKAANISINDGVLTTFSPFYPDFQSKCEEEIEKMRSEAIGDSISFFDILTKHVNHVAGYVRDGNLEQVLQSVDYKRKFPIYAKVLEIQLERGNERCNLLDSGTSILDSSFRSELKVIQKILDYLSDKDLRNLTKA